MKKLSEKQLDEMEKKLLKSEETKDIDMEIAEEFLMADLYSGFPPSTKQSTDE